MKEGGNYKALILQTYDNLYEKPLIFVDLFLIFVDLYTIDLFLIFVDLYTIDLFLISVDLYAIDLSLIFVRKNVCKNFAKFTGKHEFFLIKLQPFRTANLLQNVNSAKYFRTPILKNICESLD